MPISLALVLFSLSQASGQVPSAFDSIVLGVSRMTQVERLLGRGKVVKGGHSESARGYSMDGFGLYFDGFANDGKAIYCELVQVDAKTGVLDSVWRKRFNRSCGLLGELKFGSSKAQVTTLLQRKGIPLTGIAESTLVARREEGVGGSTVISRELEVLFDKSDRLFRVRLSGTRVTRR